MASSSSSSYRGLLATVKAELVAGKGAPLQRTELFRALDVFLPDLQTLPGPRAGHRAQVAYSPPPQIENRDLQTRNSHDRGHQESMPVSAGIWFSERDSLIASLQLLLHAVTLDKELHSDFSAKIEAYIKRFLDAGVRPRLMYLIKELEEEGSKGIIDHDLEPLSKDSSEAIVDRHAAIHKTRLSLCHCLHLSCLVSPPNSQELKDLYNLLKFCSGDESLSRDVTKLRITYTIMFTLTDALLSGAQGSQQTGCMFASDASFCQEFQQLIIDASDFNTRIEGFTGIVRLAWVTIRAFNKQIPTVTAIGSTREDDEIQCVCLNRAWDHDVFGFLNSQVFETAAFQNDEKVSDFKFTTSFCKLATSLLSLPVGRQKIMELKYTSMMALDMRKHHMKTPDQTNSDQAQTAKAQAQPLVSFLYFAKEIFQRGPELVINNDDFWNFVYFVGEGHVCYFTLVALLDMLTALAECKEGAGRVFDLLRRPVMSNLGWQNLFSSLVAYDLQLQLCADSLKSFHPPFQEGDARVLEAYLKVLEKVIEKGDAIERMQWFEDIEPLFKLLSRENVPPFLKGALRNAIAACASVSSVMKEKVCSLLHEYDSPLLATRLPSDDLGQYLTKQEYDSTSELNEVESKQKEYLSTLSYLKLYNYLSGHERDTQSGRCFEIFHFARDQVFGPYSYKLYANTVEKWELVVAVLHHFEIILSADEMLSEYKSGNEDALENPLPLMSHSNSAAKCRNATPALELMKDLHNGSVIYSNLMSILLLGVKSVLEQRDSELYGPDLEEAVSLSFHIFIHALMKESLYGAAGHGSYQDSDKVVTLLEYVRYHKSQVIQRYSVKVMELFSARVPQLATVLQQTDAVLNLTGGFAACLETCFLEAHPSENPEEDIGSLIIRILLVNLCKPPPNLTHLLLGFDVNQSAGKTTLQPIRYFSCLTVILHALDALERPDVNAGLHELGFKLLYELCVDPVTCDPMLELLRNGKYDFLPKMTPQSSHDTFLERRNSSVCGTDPLSSEDHNMELQTCDFEPAVGSVPEIPSMRKPEVGFLNPEPLATRKENDGLGDGSIAALRSSWIQRLFPGLLGESVKPAQWKGKEKHVAPECESTERLLIENAGKVPEGLGSSPQLLDRVQDQGRENRNDNGKPGTLEDVRGKSIIYPGSNSSQPAPAFTSWQGLSPTEECNPSRSQFNQLKPRDHCALGAGFSEIRKQELEKRKRTSSIQVMKSPADVDMTSMQASDYPLQRLSSFVARRSLQQEQNRHVLNGPGTSNKPSLDTQLPSLGFRNHGLQQGGTSNSSFVDYPLIGKAGVGGTKVDDMVMGENNELEVHYYADRGQNVVPLGSSPLPPLSLFAPFKHSKERRSALAEGKTSAAPGLSENTPLMTPLFSRNYKNGTHDIQGGAGLPGDKFDSSIFAPYKPASSLHNRSGMCDSGTPLTLQPIFEAFKTVEVHNRPSSSFSKMDKVPVDLVGQCSKDVVGQHNGRNSAVKLDGSSKQLELRGQLRNQLATIRRTSSVYSRTALPEVADQRKASMVSPNSVPRFHGQSSVGTASALQEPTTKEGCRTVNTSAIELSSKRPSLEESGSDDRICSGAEKDVSVAQFRGVQLSASQGMRDIFQSDQDHQRQRLNAEGESVRVLRPFSNLVSEPSSGSSPLPGGALLHQQDALNIVRAASSEVNGTRTIEGPRNVQNDAERDQLATDKEILWGTASINGVPRSALPIRKPTPDMGSPSLVHGSQKFTEPGKVQPLRLAQEDKSERSSRKRSHDERARDSQFAAQNSESVPLSIPQKQESGGDDRPSAPRSQSWLNRWMPSSKPVAAVFKTSQSSGAIPAGQSFSHVKNRRFVQGSSGNGQQVDEAGSDVQEHAASAMQTDYPFARSNCDNRFSSSNPFYPGYYPVPSAAAMALVGAASRRAVPVPQRVGTRTAIWPAIAGIQLRRSAESEPPQVEVEVVVEEG